MALTGIEIFKLLPKTNCGQCGVPTCLAFAMALAAGKADLSKCPTVSDEAKAKLSEAAAPPILPIIIGTGDKAVKIGGETVMFRHEKRFENAPAIAMLLDDTMPEAEVDARLNRFKTLEYERVGLKLRGNMLALRAGSGDPAKFAAFVNKIKSASEYPMIFISPSVDVLTAGVKAAAERKPLIYAATRDNVEKIGALAKETGCPVAAKASDYDEMAALTEKLASMGIKNIVMDTAQKNAKQALQDQIIIRSAALKKFRALGYPTMVQPREMTTDPMKEAMIAVMFIAKYAGIIVMSDFQGESLFPLLVARLNIYTDPQRPLATTQGIYEFNNPNKNSPFMITSNFSLTYFIVSGEIENSKVPSWLLVKDTEGLSVMTSWAAGKFSADVLAPAIKKSGIEGKIKHHKLIIPGYIAAESGALEEELPGWQIIVGPRDASNLPAFLKQWKA
ncbi:MAG TPA: acetyl-CoA decarbonylase/synthase complex subunit gamma [Dehalococcoidales bacterium]|nr:acetyl-CoA decarbonylase/synthase complex subunit gamma [Dehalococcoidales bacterium]